jgi:hypothetical protein
MTETPVQAEQKIIADRTVRLADLGTIRDHLLAERQRRLDVVVNRQAISWADGFLMVHAGQSTTFAGPDGKERSAAGLYRPAVTAVETAGKMHDIDVGFLKKLYEEERTDLIDALFNGRLHGSILGMLEDEAYPPDFAPYPGNMMLRLLRPDQGDEGLFRAMLSPRFALTMDNIDVATAVLAGIADAGVEAHPDVCSLTDRKMTLRFVVPGIAAMAPKLLDGYRSPLDGPGGVPRAGMDRPGMRLRVESGWRDWNVSDALAAAAREGQGYVPGTEPVVFAGFVVTNGDMGGASRTLAPQIRIRICKNGLTLMAESDRRVHLGSTQEEGVIKHGADTVAAELDLITLQTRDAISTWMSQDWFEAQVREIEALAEVKLGDTTEKVEALFRDVTKAGKFSKAETDTAWDLFLRGGAVPTVGGFGNALTAASQVLPDPDRAVQVDAQALPLMREAAKAARR